MSKVVLKIKDMDCAACAMSIDGLLEEHKGVTSSITNFAKSQTEVTYHADKISLKEIEALITKAGFTAEIANKV